MSIPKKIYFYGVYGQAHADERMQGVHVLVPGRMTPKFSETINIADLESTVLGLASKYKQIPLTGNIPPIGYSDEMDIVEVKYEDGRKVYAGVSTMRNSKEGPKFLSSIDYDKADSIKVCESHVAHLYFRLPQAELPDKVKQLMKIRAAA